LVTRWFFTGVLTVAPVAFLLWFFYSRDVHREPRSVLLRTFLLGIAAILPTLAVALPLSLLQPSAATPIRASLYAAFVTAALPEESFKLLVLLGYSARRKEFDEPMDGLVYGAAAALGFAAMENVLYVVSGGWATALLRALTAVPMHAACGAILGYGVAQSRFTARGRSAVLVGLFSAVAVHGIYDFALIGMSTIPLASSAPGAWILALLVVVIAVLVGSLTWVVRTSRRFRRQQRLEAR
jgi:RsiW-degrading membrane proteinase PrsW (M82 family)